MHFEGHFEWTRWFPPRLQLSTSISLKKKNWPTWVIAILMNSNPKLLPLLPHFLEQVHSIMLATKISKRYIFLLIAWQQSHLIHQAECKVLCNCHKFLQHNSQSHYLVSSSFQTILTNYSFATISNSRQRYEWEINFVLNHWKLGVVC